MVVIAKTRVGSGIQYNLGAKDLSVGVGVVVTSFDENAISGTGLGQRVTVSGTVKGDNDGIHLTGNDAVVIVNASGVVRGSGDDCINLEGTNGTVINRGTLSGVYGIYTDATGGTFKATNYGTILAESNGISIGGDQKSLTKNFGTIIAETSGSFDGNSQRDAVFNRGTMVGDIVLREGDDVYNGLNGRVVGTIYGGDDNDLFRAGSRAETIDGGNDGDILDFRAGSGLRVDLNNAIENTGNAKNDYYLFIETIYGSQSGADALRGDNVSNNLYGNGGADKLIGNSGNDLLSGGTGRDTLTGGFDDDSFTFQSKASCGDIITDFGNGVDDISINRDAFGAGLVDGFLVAGRFKSGANNMAGDANDRFIFNTATDKLYFDADGTGSGAAILVATFANGATLTAGDIFIF